MKLATTLPPRPLADPSEVSAFLKVTEKTLEHWRYMKSGPDYSTVGRHVRYRWSDVERWVDAQKRPA